MRDSIEALRRKGLWLGTSSWSSKDWVGVLYPEGTPQAEFILVYANHFPCVEIDATFYRVPARSTVRAWAERTPPGFRFAAKAPKTITHDAALADCAEEFAGFVDVMSELGEKLGPILLQFPYYAKASRPPLADFVGRLDAFLSTAPNGIKVAVEVRNKTWLQPAFLECLRRHNVALALIDHPWMPRPRQYGHARDLATADFAYIRWLGDRHGIERQTKTWNRTIIDRTADLDDWVPLVRAMLGLRTVREVWGFFNNHFAGHAPDSIRLFVDRWLENPGRRTP